MSWLRSLTLCTALTMTAPALARENSQAAEAEALFAEGRRLMAEGRPELACPKFEQSQKADPGAGTAINLARCYARLGRTASAWAAYRAAASASQAAGQAKRESVARAQAAALEPELARLKVSLPDGSLPEGFELLLDAAPWSAAVSELAAPVDPGAHTLVARAPGFAEWSQPFEATPRQQAELQVPALQKLPSEPVVLEPASEPRPQRPIASEVPNPKRPAIAPPVVKDTGHPTRTETSVLRPLGLVLGSAGLVGLGAGLGFGLRAKHLDAESREDGHCEPGVGCDDPGLELNRSARDASAISTVALISGATLSVAGVALYFLGGTRRSSTVSLSLSPALAARETRLVLRGEL